MAKAEESRLKPAHRETAAVTITVLAVFITAPTRAASFTRRPYFL